MRIFASVQSGDYLSPSDTGEALVGETLAGSDDPEGDSTPTLGGVVVGKTIEITFPNGFTQAFRVKGILKAGTSSVDNAVFLHRRDMARVLGEADPANTILVRTETTGKDAEMRLTLMQYGVQEKIWTWQDKSAKFPGIHRGIVRYHQCDQHPGEPDHRVVVIFIVIFISIVYRRRQIGILRASGSTARSSSSRILQALFICTCGTLAGGILLIAVLQYLAVNR